MTNQLETFCRETAQEKDLMLMTHVVCGYPSFEENWRMLELMDENGADIVELQFPFSEPSADGPLFVKANQAAVDAGVTVHDCLEFMKKASERFSFKILMMGYLNTAWKMGYEKFTDALVEAGATGFILPDLPVEECEELVRMCGRENLINLSGKLSFLESAALMQGATMNYVNDSAPMHMASAMNAPTNAVFCSTIPSFGFGPLADGAKVIETDKELACRPCGLHGKKKCPLGHFDCSYSIQKEQFDRPEFNQ